MAGPDEDDDLIWVETTPAICQYYCRNGMGKAEYFDFRGVKVCETGTKERIKTQMARQVGEIIHGDSKVQQVQSTKPGPGELR